MNDDRPRMRAVRQPEPMYRKTQGIVTAAAFLITGIASIGFAVTLSRWWLIAAVPFTVLGAMGLAVELSHPKEPRP